MGIIGIGGVFIRPQEQEALVRWYRENLGIPTEDWGHQFEWNSHPLMNKYSIFSIFASDTNYIAKNKTFMINFMVDDLIKMREDLIIKGIPIIKFEENEFGQFMWIEDPEQNKIELWQPA